MLVPLKEMGQENHRMMSNLPQQPPMASASKARFMVGWWDRTVHIWVFRKSAANLFGNEGEDEDSVDQNRKLLKTMVLKGDSNITWASINPEGTLLFVSTATDVKAFRLQHQDPEKPADVEITSIELPSKLSHLGASRIQLSPNGQWLCVVQDGARVQMASIQHESEGSVSVRLQRLSRLRRHTPRYILNGGLGSYDRSITQVTFSADSKMLATADLAGYIDTWLLHDLAGNQQNGNAEADDDASDASSDSDSSEGEDEDADANGRWERNPNAKLLPKLPTAPVVLSFSDHIPDDSADDYVLAAITSSWNVLAFHPQQGSLTPWSRRHPRKALPPPVQDLLDLPKGVVWQGSRAWIYGVSFLLMLDMGQDLPKSDGDATNGEVALQGMKRKRTGRTTGAGGKMERESLAPHQVRRHGANDEWEDIDVADAPADQDSDSDEAMTDGELSRLRANGTSEVAVAEERKKWWITYKYRPILGMMPLESDSAFEVALVERPTWDVEMPETYFGGEEWER